MRFSLLLNFAAFVQNMCVDSPSFCVGGGLNGACIGGGGGGVPSACFPRYRATVLPPSALYFVSQNEICGEGGAFPLYNIGFIHMSVCMMRNGTHRLHRLIHACMYLYCILDTNLHTRTNMVCLAACC